MTYQIVNDGTMPEIPSRGYNYSLPFDTMNIGDRLYIADKDQKAPPELEPKPRTLSNLRSLVSKANKRHPDKKFYVAVHKDDTRYFVIWRQS